MSYFPTNTIVYAVYVFNEKGRASEFIPDDADPKNVKIFTDEATATAAATTFADSRGLNANDVRPVKIYKVTKTISYSGEA